MTKTLLLWISALALQGCGEGDPGQPRNEGGEGGEAGHILPGEGGAGGAPLGGGGQAEPVCSRFASEVVEVSYGPGQDFGRDAMPDIALGPPQGAGASQGSLDVVSLGNGGSIVLGFGLGRIVDAPGPDFVVFENPFESGGAVFAELGTVAVSADGDSWHAFSCDAVAPPYGSCAGHTPVYLNDAGDEAFEPSTSGGDAFDLADLGLSEARYVRIVDREDLQGLAGVFDLDAVGIVNLGCR